MELHGTVQNGVVVFANNPMLPDGTRVSITVEEPGREATLGEVLRKYAGCMTDLPPDMAEQHDHYIHGTPNSTARL